MSTAPSKTRFELHGEMICLKHIDDLHIIFRQGEQIKPAAYIRKPKPSIIHVFKPSTYWTTNINSWKTATDQGIDKNFNTKKLWSRLSSLNPAKHRKLK